MLRLAARGLLSPRAPRARLSGSAGQGGGGGGGRRLLRWIGVGAVTASVAVAVAASRWAPPAEMATAKTTTTKTTKKQEEEETEWREFMAPPVSGVEALRATRGAMRSRMEVFIMELQAEVCRALEEVEGEGGKKFRVEQWSRPGGGGGVTCVLQEGRVFEKAGVNVSVVRGHLPPEAAAQMRSRGRDITPDANGQYPFVAMGVSSVIHPHNPHVPTLHFNYRYFEIQQQHGEWSVIHPHNPHVPTLHFNYRYFEIQQQHGGTVWWFGGGTDMTPSFLVEEDVTHFHRTLQAALTAFPGLYTHYKLW
ncbi:oxygen-dependent coproporphyrinogen-III oxidase-like [Lampetra fluviatilis]